MPRRTITTTIPVYVARTQLGSLLKQVANRKTRFVVTRSGKPTAVLLGVAISTTCSRSSTRSSRRP